MQVSVLASGVHRRRPLLRVAVAVAAAASLGGTTTAVAAPSPGARSAGDTVFPTTGNGGYDAQHYDLRLRYRPATRHLTAHAEITAEATQDLSSFSLDLQGLTVRSVKVDNAPASFARGRTKLEVTPAAALPAGARFVVSVAYDGTPRAARGRGGTPEGWVRTRGGAFVVGQPIGAQTWFPNNNTPGDKATYRIAVTVPKGLTAIGNGELRSATTHGRWRTWDWRERHPMSSYLATATLGDFRLRTHRSADGLPIYDAVDRRGLRALPADRRREFESDLAGGLEEDVVRRFSFFFGPFPFSSFGGVYAVAPAAGYALETQSKPNYASIDTTAVPHELAHQWFGNSVTPSRWADLWLNEGLAVWAGDWLYPYDRTGAAKSRKLGIPSPAGQLRELLARRANDPLWKISPGRPTAKTLFSDATYQRSAGAFEGYRQIVGDRVFYRSLRSWTRDHAHGTVTAEDWIAHTNAESGRDLRAYWNDWIFRAGKPRLTPEAVRRAGR
ncbi:M1 family metallopeptidase [Patulibacter americanus]|uniref:M1 family metallopeptidase n=1 Tax=Patulibacter americanus TaxID=588672 RepID=UPI0003B7AD77|nr:M1 family metallopeptidase [Patulibacter americanus]